MVVLYLLWVNYSSFVILNFRKPTCITLPPRPCPRTCTDAALLCFINWPDLLTNKYFVAASIIGYLFIPTYASLYNYSIVSSYLMVYASFKKHTVLNVSVSFFSFIAYCFIILSFNHLWNMKIRGPPWHFFGLNIGSEALCIWIIWFSGSLPHC